jgi:hypothetical protein
VFFFVRRHIIWNKQRPDLKEQSIMESVQARYKIYAPCAVGIPKGLRFYEDATKVVQRRMVPNFKKSFERAVRTARR